MPQWSAVGVKFLNLSLNDISFSPSTSKFNYADDNALSGFERTISE